MVAARRHVVAIIVCLAISLALHGCNSAVRKTLDSMIATICANNIRTIAQGAEQQYQKMAFSKCQALKDKALETLNEEKANDIHQRCLDSAGVSIEEEESVIEENYTDQCVKRLGNVSDFSSTTQAVKDWINSVNLSAVFADDFKLQIDLKLTDLQKELEDEIASGPGDKPGEQDNKTTGDTPENDDTAETTKEHSTTEEPAEERPAVRTTVEPETASSTHASTDNDTAKSTRLFDSRIQMHISPGAGNVAVSLVAAGAFVGMLWLVVLRRRVGSTSWDPVLDELVDAESDIADA